MTGLARLQDTFQRGVLDGDDAVLAEIGEGARETREVLFGVYRNAYVLRLVEVLGNDHEVLQAYLGDAEFDAMARAYVAATPSRHANARWYSQGLPAFLRRADPYRDYAEIGDLAALEKALNDAFDAPDDNVLAFAEVAEIPPEAWRTMTFRAHASAARLDATTNVAAVWAALREDEAPPPAAVLDEPARVMVWRHETMSMFRELSAEEAMMWDEAAAGVPFGTLCEMLATYDDPDSAAARAAGYLQGWIAAGMLAGVTSAD